MRVSDIVFAAGLGLAAATLVLFTESAIHHYRLNTTHLLETK